MQMFRETSTYEPPLRLLMKHLHHSIAVAGGNPIASNTGLIIRLLLDSYFKDIVLWGTSFSEPGGLKPGNP